MGRTIRPMVIRVELDSPYIDNGEPIHLDGLLAQAISRRMGLRVPTRVEPVRDFVDLPLVMSNGVWAASAGQPVGVAIGTVVHQTKRRDQVDYDWLAAPVSVAAGVHKDRLLRRPAILTEAVEFRAVGNRGLVNDCLRLLWGPSSRPTGFIGSARRTGSGQIRSWSIEYRDFDPHDVWVRDGIAQRHLPEGFAESADRFRLGSCEPPYWHPSRHVPCVPVGVRVQLRGQVWQDFDLALEAANAAS